MCILKAEPNLPDAYKERCINCQLPSDLSVNKLIVSLDDFLSFSRVGWRLKGSFLQIQNEVKNFE